MSRREGKEHPLSFLLVRGLSGVNIVAPPISQWSSGGLRRGITVAIVGSGIGFLAFTGLTARSGAWRPGFPIDGDQHFRLMTTTCSGPWRPGQQGCGRA
jgi:hypothetical protein